MSATTPQQRDETRTAGAESVAGASTPPEVDAATASEFAAHGAPVPEQEPADHSHPRARSRILLIGALAVLAAGAVIWGLTTAVPQQSETVQLPDGFPAQQELPLVTGDLSEAAELPGSQSTATVVVVDEAQQQAALGALRDAGYRVIGSEGSGPVGTVTSLSSDTRSVRVEFNQNTDGKFTVTYLTSPRVSNETDAS